MGDRALPCPLHVSFCLSGVQSIDSSLEESSQILGANVFTTFRKITFPLIMPSIVSGAILVAVSSIGLFGIVAILGTPKGIFMLTNSFNGRLPVFPSSIISPPHQCCFLSVPLSLLPFSGVSLRRRINDLSLFLEKCPGREQWTWGSWRWPAAGVYGLFILVGVLLPYFILIIVSLSYYWSGSISLKTLTMANYHDLFFGSYAAQVRSAFSNSMLLGVEQRPFQWQFVSLLPG